MGLLRKSPVESPNPIEVMGEPHRSSMEAGPYIFYLKTTISERSLENLILILKTECENSMKDAFASVKVSPECSYHRRLFDPEIADPECKLRKVRKSHVSAT